MPSKTKDIANFYNYFTVGKNSKSLRDELLYQLYKKPIKDKKAYSPRYEPQPSKMSIQTDTLYLPNDDGYKYALVCVDLGSRATDAEPIKNLDSKTVLKAIQTIFKRKIVYEPSQTIQVDSGSEFKGEFKKYFENNGIKIKVANTGRKRSLALAESRNKSIGTILLKRMTAQELKTGEASREWVKFLPTVIKYLNSKFEIKEKDNPYNDKTPNYDVIFGNTRCKGKDCEIIPIGTYVRYQLDQPIGTDEKKLYGKFRSGDIKFSIKPTKIEYVNIQPNQPIFYKLAGRKGYYTRNQLQIVNKSQLNIENIE